MSVKLLDLKVKTTLQGSFPLELESKRFVPTYDITIQVRQPVAEKEYRVESKTVLTITKTFPPFTADYSSNTASEEIVHSQPKAPVEQTKKNSVKQEAAHVNLETKPISTSSASVNKPQSTEDKISADLFTKVELSDPDDIESLNTLKVLDIKIRKVEAEIAKVEGRIPMDIRQRKMKLSCKRNMIKQSIEEGSITLDQYTKVITNQLAKDTKLSKYFKQTGQQAKQILVEERILALSSELKEADQLSKQPK